VYAVGFIISLVSSVQCLLKYSDLKKNMGIDLLKIRPGMKFYILFKPIFWPLYFIIEKSPIERLSEMFFKHYGDADHCYFGNQGIKNFVNDVFRGKNRYKNYQATRLIWELDKKGSEYQEYIKHSDNTKSVCAGIICARHKEKYLLGVTLGVKECLGGSEQISRFELDQCAPLSASELKERLFQINPVKAVELLNS
jgi:hypothetical protein